MLSENESRWRTARHRRILSVAAVVGTVVFFAAFSLAVAFEINGKLAALAAMGAGLVVAAALEATVGRKRKFPYLDEYDD